jgi:signal transduction histidine kinase
MRRRIVLAILAIAAFAVVLFGVPLGIAVRSQEIDEATLRLERQATLAARVVSSDSAGAADPVELPAAPSDVTYGFYSAAGTLLAGNGPEQGDQPVLDAAGGSITDTEGNGKLVVAVPVSANESVVGIVRAEQSMSGVESRVWGRWAAMAGLAVLVLAIASVVAILVSRRLTRPIEDVREAARRLGDGDFSVTVPTSGLTDVDEVAEALTATARRLGDLVDRERAFSANASHQLRTPLTGLRLTIETELADPRDDPTGVLRESLDELDRLEATIDQLLTLARDSGGHREPVDLSALLDGLDRRWHGPLAGSGRPLRLAVHSPLPRPEVSALAISQVLDVLVDNASRHGTGEVSIEAHAVTAGVAVSVSDEGSGIVEPERVFERRQTTGNGYGIGLALARSLAEAEGCRLVLERPSPHPRFVLLLPAQA